MNKTNSLQKILEISKEFAVSQAEEYGLPSLFHLELSYKKGQWLAEELGADKDIVAIGTYLMDCMLGVAFSEGKKEEHVEMSKKKAQEIFSDFDLDKEVLENILTCVSQHHGNVEFSSLESEICCNADCFRFASVDGFIGGIHRGRKMKLSLLLGLYGAKADEKWNALTLDICKTELKIQYDSIKQLISNYKE